jgi:predicted metal-dependent hydrolase
MATTETRRHIVLAGVEVSYLLRRSQRRTIGLTVGRNGLRVGAPGNARQGDIDALLLRHADWVLTKLRAWQERAAETPPEIADGMALPLFGEPWRLTLTPAARLSFTFDPASRTLTLGLRADADRSNALRRVLQTHARMLFAERLQYYGTRLGAELPPLALTAARTRWGSCSRRGIRLNWRLVHFPPAVVDYVVAHEVAHLREMNHSPRFWAVVESLYPNWRQARRQLKELAPTLPPL